MALVSQTTLDGGAGDDTVYGSQKTKTETLKGGDGNDVIVASSTGTLNGDIILGGAGDDMLVGGDDPDTFTGGSGADIFVIDNEDTLLDVNTNTAFENVSNGGVDNITDFENGTDKIQLLSPAFDGFAAGTLTNGVNFSVINDSYDGTNAGTNVNHGQGLDSFVY